jgi:hypothetical protein
VLWRQAAEVARLRAMIAAITVESLEDRAGKP